MSSALKDEATELFNSHFHSTLPVNIRAELNEHYGIFGTDDFLRCFLHPPTDEFQTSYSDAFNLLTANFGSVRIVDMKSYFADGGGAGVHGDCAARQISDFKQLLEFLSETGKRSKELVDDFKKRLEIKEISIDEIINVGLQLALQPHQNNSDNNQQDKQNRNDFPQTFQHQPPLDLNMKKKKQNANKNKMDDDDDDDDDDVDDKNITTSVGCGATSPHHHDHDDVPPATLTTSTTMKPGQCSPKQRSEKCPSSNNNNFSSSDSNISDVKPSPPSPPKNQQASLNNLNLSKNTKQNDDDDDQCNNHHHHAENGNSGHTTNRTTSTMNSAGNETTATAQQRANLFLSCVTAAVVPPGATSSVTSAIHNRFVNDAHITTVGAFILAIVDVDDDDEDDDDGRGGYERILGKLNQRHTDLHSTGVTMQQLNKLLQVCLDYSGLSQLSIAQVLEGIEAPSKAKEIGAQFKKTFELQSVSDYIREIIQGDREVRNGLKKLIDYQTFITGAIDLGQKLFQQTQQQQNNNSPHMMMMMMINLILLLDCSLSCPYEKIRSFVESIERRAMSRHNTRNNNIWFNISKILFSHEPQKFLEHHLPQENPFDSHTSYRRAFRFVANEILPKIHNDGRKACGNNNVKNVVLLLSDGYPTIAVPNQRTGVKEAQPDDDMSFMEFFSQMLQVPFSKSNPALGSAVSEFVVVQWLESEEALQQQNQQKHSSHRPASFGAMEKVCRGSKVETKSFILTPELPVDVLAQGILDRIVK